jgi:hypothetical protein
LQKIKLKEHPYKLELAIAPGKITACKGIPNTVFVPILIEYPLKFQIVHFKKQ